MRPHREVRVWKRKKVEVEARILRLEALKEQTRIWMKKASEKRLELGWKSSTYQQLVELHSQRLPQVIEETAVKLSQAQLELTEIEQRIEQLLQQPTKIIPLAVVLSMILLLGLGILFIDPGITGLSVKNVSISPPPSLDLYDNTIDMVSIPVSISPAAKKAKNIDDIISETKLKVPREKIKDITQLSYSSEEIDFTDWKYTKGLVVHKPLIDGKTFAEAVPLVDKDTFTYSADFEGTILEVEFAAAEIKNDKVGRKFQQSKFETDREWKIAYSYLLPALNFTLPLRVSSSSPITVEDASIGKVHSGSFILSFEEERQNGYGIQVDQVSDQVVYVYLSKNYTEEGKAVDDEIIIDPSLTVSGTSTELCGTVTEYDLIDINTGGVLTICQANSTSAGGVNISLGYFGNFSLDASSWIEGKGAGENGGVGGTQGDDGNHGTAGSANVATPNGGGGGGGQKKNANDAAAGAGGGFGGAGGNGGLSIAGTQGLGGLTYGAYNALDLKMGSGGGGSEADTDLDGGDGGGGIKIVAGAGGWVGIRGSINVTGNNGTDAVAGTQDSAGGGGGSGGHIIIVAGTLNLNGAVMRADGGGGGLGSGTDSCPGGGGGGGRIYLVYETLQANSTFITTNHGYLGGNVSADAACDNPSDALGPTHGANGTIQFNGTYFDRLPIITLLAPANLTINSTTSTPDFVFNVSDDLFAQPYLNCTLWLSSSAGTQAYGTNNTVFNATKTSITTNATLSNGPYSWMINCSDGFDPLMERSNSSETRNITIDIVSADQTPLLSLLSPANHTRNTTDTTPEFMFNVTDDMIAQPYLNCTLWMNNGTDAAFGTNNTVFNATKAIISANSSLNDGNYLWWTNCSDGVQSNLSEIRNISIATNGVPSITFVSNLSAVSIIEGGVRQINFSFLASDPDGRGDLDNTSAQLRISRLGEADRTNTSCTPVGTFENNINYSCSINLWYYDGAGFWTINASIRDTQSLYSENNSMQFMVLETTAFAIGPTALTWATLELGNTNRTATNDPMTLNNTGNKDIVTTGITVTGYDLRGLTTTTEFIRRSEERRVG